MNTIRIKKSKVIEICNWIQSDNAFLIDLIWVIGAVVYLIISPSNVIIQYIAFSIFFPLQFFVYALSGLIIKRYYKPVVGLFSTKINKEINNNKKLLEVFGILWLLLIFVYEIYIHLTVFSL